MSGSTESSRLRLWKQLVERGKGRGFISGTQKLPTGLYWAPVDGRVKPGILFSYTIWKNRPEAAAERYIHQQQSDSKRAFSSLQEKKLQIERSFGDRLIWDRSTGEKASRIRYVFHHGGLNEEQNWPIIQEEMVSAMERLAGAIKPYL